MAAINDTERRGLERNLPVFYVFRGIAELQFLAPLWIIYLTDKRDLSLEQVTLLDGPFWLWLIVMEVPTGVVADRYGRKLSLVIGALLNTVGIALFAVATSFPMLLFSYVIWGTAITFYSGASDALLFDTLRALGRESEFRKATGRSLAIVATAHIIATLIGPLVAGATDIVVPIWMSAGSMALAFFAAIFLVEPPRFDQVAGPALGYLASVRSALREIWNSTLLRPFVALVAVTNAITLAVFFFTQPFLRRHDVEASDVGWFMVFSQLAALPAYLVAHRMGVFLGPRRAVVVPPLLVTVVVAFMATFDSLNAFLLFPLVAFLSAISKPIFSDYVNQRIGSAQRATVLSFQNLLLSFTLVTIEIGMGVTAERSSLPNAFALAALFMVAVGLPLLFLWLRADRKAGPVAPVVIPVTDPA